MTQAVSRFSHLVLAMGLVLLAPGFALGQEEPEDRDCTAVERDPLDLGRPYIEWVYEAGSPSPRIAVRASDRDGMVYWIDARLQFGGQDVTWSQGPYLLDPLDDATILVELPEEAHFSVHQAAYVSDLAVRVVATQEVSEVTVDRAGAERLQVVWPEGEDVLLMDAAMTEAFAPNGILGDFTTVEREEPGSVYEYGPPR